MKFRMEVLHKMLCSSSEFRENRLSDSHTLLNVLNDFYTFSFHIS